MWPQDTARGTNTLLDASGNPGVPAGGENVRIAVLATQASSFKSNGSRTLQGWRRGPGAPANEPSKHDSAGLAKL